ncbi:hypothetical protein BDN72DRAFT_772405, partial [Pluteus cervinus]
MSSNGPPLLDAHAEERALIDTRIAELEHEIRSLKLQRNQLAPIARLPPELFTRIFSFFQ